MAVRLYDEAIYSKIKSWVRDPNMKILKPDEVTRLFEIRAEKEQDKPLSLPLIAISRDKNVEILQNKKHPMSFSGVPLGATRKVTATLDAIPFITRYQLDIFTERYEEGDEYMRNFVFQLINNPKLKVQIPYNDANIEHLFYLRLLSTITDNSDISNRLFPGQFTRWTLQLEIQDAFFFSVPITKNWSIDESAGLIIQNNNNQEEADEQESIPLFKLSDED